MPDQQHNEPSGHNPGEMGTAAPGGTKTEHPPPNCDSDHPDKSGPSAFERAKFGVEIAAFVALAIYTVITFCMWRTTKDSVDVARQAVISTNRPWLVPKEIEVDPFVANKTGHAAVVIDNVGQGSPATNVSAVITLKAAPISVVDSMAKGLAGIEWRQDGAPRGLPPPGEFSHTKNMAIVARGIPVQVILPCRPYSPEELAWILDGRVTFYIWGVIKYSDQFGTNGETGFCAFWVPPGYNIPGDATSIAGAEGRFMVCGGAAENYAR